MEFLHLLSKIRNPFLDFLFSAITLMGDEIFFLAVAIFFFWCVDKRRGYYILLTGLFGTIINQGMKMLIRIERPWILDGSFRPVKSAVEGAGGYSFPSGHTQNVTGTFGAIALSGRGRGLRIVCAAVIALVAFSRMYLGVHTPLDVLASLLIGAALVLILRPIFLDEELFRRAMPWLVGASALLAFGLLLYVNLLPSSIAASDPVAAESYIYNLNSAKENAATLFGCMLGLVLVYPLDRFVIKFKTEATWYANLIKLALGLCIVLLVLRGSEGPLDALFGLVLKEPVFVARAVRYFLVVAVAGALWPLSFGFFSTLRIKPLDRFTEWVKAHIEKS